MNLLFLPFFSEKYFSSINYFFWMQITFLTWNLFYIRITLCRWINELKLLFISGLQLPLTVDNMDNVWIQTSLGWPTPTTQSNVSRIAKANPIAFFTPINLTRITFVNYSLPVRSLTMRDAQNAHPDPCHARLSFVEYLDFAR